MERRKKIAIYGLITGTVLFFVTLLAGCYTTAEENNHKAAIEKTKSEKHSCCDEVDSDDFSDASVFHLESQWTDQNGNSFLLKDLEGKKTVFTMFFASCTYACPILVNDMKKIETEIAENGDLSSYKFVLVSIDPERDTPRVLSDFAKRYNLDSDRWMLLTSGADDVMELAAVTGFKYKKDKDGEYSHSNLITFFNEGGEITHQHVGLNKDITIAAEKLLSMK